MSFDWKALVKSVAPTIGTALAGPFGTMAGLAVAKAIGVPDDQARDPSALAAAIQGATPDQMLALKKADQDFALQMKQLGFEDAEALAKIFAGDRSDARARQVAMKDYTPSILGYGITLGFFGVLAYMIKWGLPADPGSKDAMLMMLGALGAAWSHGVIGYFFGASNGDSASAPPREG